MRRGQIIVGLALVLSATCTLGASPPPATPTAAFGSGSGTLTWPLPAPGYAPQKDETFVAADKNAVAAECSRGAFEDFLGLLSNPKPKVLRIAVTRSAKWGTIWRADVRVPGWTTSELPSFVRAVCWADRKSGLTTQIFVEPKIPGVSSGKWCMGPVPRAASPPPPRAYKDARTNILFYTESDGQHLAALGADGKLLWVRNPFADRDMCPYRVLNPHIVFLKAADPREVAGLAHVPEMHIDSRDKFLWVGFDSSQFGIVDEKNGDFFPEGQN